MGIINLKKKLFGTLCLLIALAWAQNIKPSELNNVNIIEDNVGENISLDRNFIDQKGNEVNLQGFAQGNNVLVINFVYFTCPMICGAASDGLARALADLDLPSDKNYKVISISMNPTDDVDSANNYWKKYVKKVGSVEEYGDKWTFLVSPDNVVKQFAEDVGFKYTKDEKSGEFFHSTGVFIVNGKGLISRILYGIAPKPADLKLSIIEASDNKYRTTLEKALLYCFTYDPKKNSYVVHAFNIMQFAGLLTVFSILLMIFILKRRENPHNNK